MSDSNIPLRVIAELSGHRDLAQLCAYLEVRDEQVLGAAASLSMLSPMMGEVGKVFYYDYDSTPQQMPVDFPKLSPVASDGRSQPLEQQPQFTWG